MSTSPGSPTSLAQKGGAWRTDVACRIAALEHRQQAAETAAQAEAEALSAPTLAEPPEAELVAVGGDGGMVDVKLRRPTVAPAAKSTHPQDHLDAAKAALADAKAAVEHTTGVGQWWSGSGVTAAWESVHVAEAELVEVDSDAGVRAALPRLQAWMGDVMSATQRKPYEDPLAKMAGGDTAVDRAVVRQAYTAVTAANNEHYQNARTLRNLMLLVSAGLAFAVLVATIWHAFNPDVLSLCRGTRSQTCFGGGKEPVARSVLEVVAVGALGGLLGVAFLLTKSIDSPPNRYNLIPAQYAMKVVVGAAAALAGVLLLLSGLIVEVKDFDTARLLGYAVLFGLSQELLTRFVDKKVEDLTSTKDDK